MNSKAVEILRAAWRESATYKLICAVIIFGNLIVAWVLWSRLAPEDLVKPYGGVVSVVSVIVSAAEILLLHRRLSPDRPLTTNLKWIFGVGAVAALALSVWVGTQLDDRPVGSPPGQETRDLIRQAERATAGNSAVEDYLRRRNARGAAATQPATTAPADPGR